MDTAMCICCHTIDVLRWLNLTTQLLPSTFPRPQVSLIISRNQITISGAGETRERIRMGVKKLEHKCIHIRSGSQPLSAIIPNYFWTFWHESEGHRPGMSHTKRRIKSVDPDQSWATVNVHRWIAPRRGIFVLLHLKLISDPSFFSDEIEIPFKLEQGTNHFLFKCHPRTEELVAKFICLGRCCGCLSDRIHLANGAFKHGNLRHLNAWTLARARNKEIFPSTKNFWFNSWAELSSCFPTPASWYCLFPLLSTTVTSPSPEMAAVPVAFSALLAASLFVKKFS